MIGFGVVLDTSSDAVGAMLCLAGAGVLVPGATMRRQAVGTALRLLMAALVTVGCLYFALRGTQWAEVRHVLAGTHVGWVALMMAVSVVTVYMRALRWQVLLSGVQRVPVRPLFSATAVGF